MGQIASTPGTANAIDGLCNSKVQYQEQKRLKDAFQNVREGHDIGVIEMSDDRGSLKKYKKTDLVVQTTDDDTAT